MRLIILFIFIISMNNAFPKQDKLFFEGHTEEGYFSFDNTVIDKITLNTLLITFSEFDFQTNIKSTISSGKIFSWGPCIEHPTLENKNICTKKYIADPRYIKWISSELKQERKRLEHWKFVKRKSPSEFHGLIKDNIQKIELSLQIYEAAINFMAKWDFDIITKFEKDQNVLNCSLNSKERDKKDKWKLFDTVTTKWVNCLKTSVEKKLGLYTKKDIRKAWNKATEKYKIQTIITNEWES